MTELNDIVDTAKAAFLQAATPADLENAKALFLGKSGKITELMKGMAALSVEEKKSRGAAINLAKQQQQTAGVILEAIAHDGYSGDIKLLKIGRAHV